MVSEMDNCFSLRDSFSGIATHNPVCPSWFAPWWIRYSKIKEQLLGNMYGPDEHLIGAWHCHTGNYIEHFSEVLKINTIYNAFHSFQFSSSLSLYNVRIRNSKYYYFWVFIKFKKHLGLNRVRITYKEHWSMLLPTLLQAAHVWTDTAFQIKESYIIIVSFWGRAPFCKEGEEGWTVCVHILRRRRCPGRKYIAKSSRTEVKVIIHRPCIKVWQSWRVLSQVLWYAYFVLFFFSEVNYDEATLEQQRKIERDVSIFIYNLHT